MAEFHPGMRFPRDEASLDPFLPQMVPLVGPIDLAENASAMSALFHRIGPGVLVARSRRGGMGWRTAIQHQQVRAVVSLEPGRNFAFPARAVPEPSNGAGGSVRGVPVSWDEFKALTRIPIILRRGDPIPDEPSAHPGQDQWRATLALARKWRAAVNRQGRAGTRIQLPEVGIRGNPHFPMADLNHGEVANHLAAFLEQQGLAQGKPSPSWLRSPSLADGRRTKSPSHKRVRGRSNQRPRATSMARRAQPRRRAAAAASCSSTPTVASKPRHASVMLCP